MLSVRPYLRLQLQSTIVDLESAIFDNHLACLIMSSLRPLDFARVAISAGLYDMPAVFILEGIRNGSG